MSTANLSRTMHNWHISYNPYTDIFQIYTNRAFSISNRNTSSYRKGDAVILYDRSSEAPVLFEFKKAYLSLGDIDNMSKQDIITRVLKYIDDHGKEKS